MKYFFLLSGCVLIFSASCGRKYSDQPLDEKPDRDVLLNANREVVHDEAKAIEEFIQRHGWKMQMTGTGLHYEIDGNATGDKADAGSMLTVAYKVYLLDGTLCYEATKEHPLKLVTGRGQQINGLEEGLQMMQKGQHARFVIPNHLAYGLTGDQDKIPPAAALYYDVELINVEPLKK